MTTVSLCMIVKNEEDTIKRCLDSVRAATDEIIVLDTGSTDNTVNLAREAGASVYHFAWTDDFAAARNAAFAKATMQYIMWLDADDVLTEENLKKLLLLKQTLDGSIRQVAAKYEVGFDEAGNVTLSFYRERLFLRTAGFVWKDAVHETIPLEKDAFYADFAVTHKKIHPTEKGRNLRIYEKMRQSGKQFCPREQYYYARELFYNDRVEEAAKQFTEFLDSDAWIEDKIGACLLLSRCYVALNLPEDAIAALTRSFVYDQPRAEICCELGLLFFKKADYTTAIYWYHSAMNDTPDEKSGAFIQRDCYAFIPLIQLAVCYDRLKEYETAYAYNEQAGLIKPDNSAVKTNREYFLRRFAENGIEKQIKLPSEKDISS